MNTPNLQEFARNAGQLLERIGVYEMPPEPVRLHIDIERFGNPAEAAAALARLPSQGGWSQQAAKVRVFHPGPARVDDQDGPILHAEAFGADKGWTLRHLGGAWQLATFSESDIAGAQGDECLAMDETLLATGDGDLTALTYRVYWRCDDAAGWRPFAACLKGFDSRKNAENDNV